MTQVVVVVSALFGYMIFAWFAAKLLGLTGIDLYFVRGILWALGLGGAGIFLWWSSRKRKRAQAEAGSEASGAADTTASPDDVSGLVREAEARLAASALAKGGKIGSLPVVFVLGAPGSAKTNTVLRSGLEPELIAGQVHQENAVAPTRVANVWFARQAVIVEAGGNLLAGDPGSWIKLVRQIDPGRLGGVVGKGEQAPRSALVCFDIEDFLKPGAVENVPAIVRMLAARLNDISQALGVRVPVYAMFTKADRVPFFLDYVRNLGGEEAGQVFGATLAAGLGETAGVYAEQAERTIGAAFDELFHSLADHRADFLARENAAEKLPGVYEYPREFRKLRAAVVQFLVELCKPSQLSAAPFLRGFYFSGVRPVVVTDVVQAAPVEAATPFQRAGSATGVFKTPTGAPQPAAQPRTAGTRRVPQWIFLTHFWNDVVLADRAAAAASTASVKTSAVQRIVYASAAALCLLLTLLLTISYVRNSRLENRVLDAARGISAVPVSAQEVPPVSALERLEALRLQLATLSAYERNGAPLSMRWGLYTGSKLYPDVRRLYFSRFHALLFSSLQAGMVSSLARLPAAPSPTDAYAPPYNTLKAYLITTSEHRRSTRAFLGPYLLNRWNEGRSADPERTQLVQKQFDFYAEELAADNPFSSVHEASAVEHARDYLKKFNAEDRIYESLVQEASRRFPPVNYNRQFPNEAVTDAREVRGAFTRDGWNFLQAAFKKPDALFGGEDWVLGPQTLANFDRTQLEAKLRSFYSRDLIREWREFLKAASVSPYRGLGDASKKLGIISANTSPLLALICLVSQHTNVDAAEVKQAFQAPQQVVPPACQSQYVLPPNQPYMGSLLKLQNLVQQVAASPQGAQDPAAGQTLQAANEALQITGQVAQGFAIDSEGNLPATVKKLMEDPITQVSRMLKGMGPGELRAKGQALCNQIHALAAKYPFNPKSQTQATIDDLNRLFRPPDGALWKLYESDLQNLMQKQATGYAAKTGGTMQVTPAFVSFFNRAAAFSEAAYAGGAQQPRLNYMLKSDLSGTNQSITLSLEGQQFAVGSGKSGSMKFVWPGPAPSATMTVKFGGEGFNWPRYEGIWAAFDFFGDSEERAQTGSAYRLEWTLRTGQSGRTVSTAGGQPVSVRFELDMLGGPPVFRKGYFTGFGCTADVAR